MKNLNQARDFISQPKIKAKTETFPLTVTVWTKLWEKSMKQINVYAWVTHCIVSYLSPTRLLSNLSVSTLCLEIAGWWWWAVWRLEISLSNGNWGVTRCQVTSLHCSPLLGMSCRQREIFCKIKITIYNHNWSYLNIFKVAQNYKIIESTLPRVRNVLNKISAIKNLSCLYRGLLLHRDSVTDSMAPIY